MQWAQQCRPPSNAFMNRPILQNDILTYENSKVQKIQHHNFQSSNSNNINNGVLQISEENMQTFKWRSMIDNVCIEMLSSIVINLTSIFGYDYSGDKFALQFTPALITGLVMMGLKDEDYYFPDASPLVTFLMWSIGAYSLWVQAIFRLIGHLIGFFISGLFAFTCCICAVTSPR